jgi:protein ImuB
MVLATEGPHGPVIHATNRAARLAGARRGTRVVDIRALCPEMKVEYADVAGDIAALERIAHWARRWCPWTAPDGADGLILDTTGSDHLYGGEAALLIDMETRFSSAGFTARSAIAPTRGAAWALARHGPVRAICMADQIALHIAGLPVPGLRLGAETVLVLQRLGLKTIGDLAALPRAPLARRFARDTPAGNPLIRLDQAMGHLSEPVSSEDEAPDFQAMARLAEPVQDPTAFLPDLCRHLCDDLARAGVGCRRLALTVYRTDGEVSTIRVVTAAPGRDAKHLLRLFGDKLAQIDPGFGFDLILLAAQAIEPLGQRQTKLDGDAADDLHLPHLIDRLIARFGPRAVTRPMPYASHVPERAEIRGAALATAMQATVAPPPTERPIRLLDRAEEVQVVYAVPEGPPVQFIWRRQTHRVARYAGPERIAPEWWRDQPGTRLRDYFKIENQAGLRLWLYREGVHDDGRGGMPRWFVHGMFA